MKHILVLFFAFLFWLNTFSHENSDEIAIQGTVVSKDKCPLADVLVSVTDTGIRTKTDKDGNFTLICPAESILYFSVNSKRYSAYVGKFVSDQGNEEQKYTFFTNFKRNQKCTQLKSSGKKIFLNELSYSPLIPVAYYDTDIEKITLKILEQYKEKNYKVCFVINGVIYKESEVVTNLPENDDLLLIEFGVELNDTHSIKRYDFSKFKAVTVLRGDKNTYTFLMELKE